MITVIGSGSWGTALAAVLNDNDNHVCIYGREKKVLTELKQKNTNTKYLGNISLFKNLENISVTDDLSTAITIDTKAIVVVIPSEVFVDVLSEIKDILQNKKLINKKIPIVIATKGLSDTADPSKPKWLHEIVYDYLGMHYPVCVLSGPSFAKEVAAKLPTSIVMAAESLELATEVSQYFHNNWFRVYTGTDLIGVELGGALKNILALVAGCAEGIGFGCNTRAALITRGLHEMLSLGDALGVKQDTLMGLSGLGDLVLTATDNQSRNKRFGNYLGQGMDIKTATQKVGQHVASYDTTRLIYSLVKYYNLDLPLTEHAYKVLFENMTIKQAIQDLSSRPQRQE